MHISLFFERGFEPVMNDKPIDFYTGVDGCFLSFGLSLHLTIIRCKFTMDWNTTIKIKT